MKKIITLSMLLISSTMFAPGVCQEGQVPKKDCFENSGHNPAPCHNFYCIFCTLGCAYCCAPRSEKPTTEARITPPSSRTHEKMN